ncbi:MAG: histidine kinase N-terminal 7TM domain-containing protein [Anaerolineae bacterium]|nr:histidine kinase N-terminal 7TM domain-containing protein [Anaerolineae bacterium]
MTAVTLDWTDFLSFGNLILSSAIVILAFSELIYMLTHNLRSEVVRGFCALLGCVLVVYGGDIILPRVSTASAANLWLRVQWLGIAFVPAAYFDFSDALLCTTNARSRRRRRLVVVSYVWSAVLFGLAAFTDLLVYDGEFVPPVSHLAAGPLFGLFTVYFALTALYGAWNLYRAWRRCLTAASRRRMAYLAISFAGPGLGVFPYLVFARMAGQISPEAVLLLTLVGNLGVGAMLVIMSYSVAYYGVLMPDRVVKHSFIHYLLRGPFVGICVIAVMLVIPRVEDILGLPRDTVLIFAVVGTIVFLQLLINLAKPWIDRLIYRQDREEITWIQELDKRLLTSSDLAQFLQNVLIALCDLLRVKVGFIVVPADEGARVEASCGARDEIEPLLSGQLARLLIAPPGEAEDRSANGFIQLDGYRLWRLRSQGGEQTLGLLGVATRDTTPCSPEQEKIVRTLLDRAAAALEDRHLQQSVFVALQRIIPQIERIQQWRGDIRYVGSPAFLPLLPEGELAAQPDFLQWVRDALRHYWGGPKLVRSPLLGLRIVTRALQEHEGNPIRALRAVLRQAIEHLRPAGERRMTAPEWLLYNILDLRFIQRKQVREIARHLAMSESDLYRKQRLAIEEVARVLVDMEVAEVLQTNGSHRTEG